LPIARTFETRSNVFQSMASFAPLTVELTFRWGDPRRPEFFKARQAGVQTEVEGYDASKPLRKPRLFSK
jgi:hypothetical protein